MFTNMIIMPNTTLNANSNNPLCVDSVILSFQYGTLKFTPSVVKMNKPVDPRRIEPTYSCKMYLRINLIIMSA